MNRGRIKELQQLVPAVVDAKFQLCMHIGTWRVTVECLYFFFRILRRYNLTLDGSLSDMWKDTIHMLPQRQVYKQMHCQINILHVYCCCLNNLIVIYIIPFHWLPLNNIRDSKPFTPCTCMPPSYEDGKIK